MIRLKPIGIILAMLLSIYLIGIVNNSEAASITYLNVYANTDYGGGSHFSASLFADENINFIDWYVKKTYPKREDGKENDYEHVHTSMHGGTSSVSVSFGTFDGDIKIAEYDVKAVVAFEGDSDTSTTKTYVYKPVFEGGYKKTGANGYSELTAHYYDGSYIVMDGFAWVYNGTENNVSGSGRFRHTAVNQPLDEKERDLPDKTIPSGETYSHSTSDWGTDFNFFCGTLQEGNPWDCNAYLRIKAHQGKNRRLVGGS